MKSLIAVLGLALTGSVALAQHHGGHHHHHAPYAGMEQREIKALSEQDIADLRAGRGMTLALAAELNGYPGPLHTLELAEDLGLTPDQRAATEALYEEMRAAAADLGERILEKERHLDRLFRDGHPTEEAVTRATAETARLQGELRAHHLNYHLAMMTLLDDGQIVQYSRLRGYDGVRPH